MFIYFSQEAPTKLDSKEEQNVYNEDALEAPTPAVLKVLWLKCIHRQGDLCEDKTFTAANVRKLIVYSLDAPQISSPMKKRNFRDGPLTNTKKWKTSWSWNTLYN